ncbi:hypothetical protein SKAU_G00074030 [Synaphobranchus kaupii]|uniref:HAT C-terminal dimerisation domain-containing protein n=1 Tax=Synaphobranchus kaupii TaxID=118154 RepID=A0A9Q1G7A3_SYNKA|nr:hypothetical protein SKAU_G00074030 [Synaphobranchus kaupii]
MVAAFKPEDANDTRSSSEEEDAQGSDEGEEERRYGAVERTPCVVHTLQLVLNLMGKEPTVKRLLDKARNVVQLFRKSSVAKQRLLEQCGLTVIKDCPTRWLTTHQMVSRLLDLQEPLTQVGENMGWDCLLPREWQQMAVLRDLLLPFAEHTNMLQSDTNSLSLVVPALLDLKIHLSQFSQAQIRTYKHLAVLAKKIAANMEQRFSCFICPKDPKFSPLAAAACFLDATVAVEALIGNKEENIKELLKKAEHFLHVTAHPGMQGDDGEEQERLEAPPAKRSRFRFLSKNCPPRPSTSSIGSIRQEIRKYREDLSQQEITHNKGMEFWLTQSSTIYPQLKPLALDLLAMPASQAFAERVFSATGGLTCCHRNRARLTLERSAFLKMNHK